MGWVLQPWGYPCHSLVSYHAVPALSLLHDSDSNVNGKAKKGKAQRQILTMLPPERVKFTHFISLYAGDSKLRKDRFRGQVLKKGGSPIDPVWATQIGWRKETPI